MLFKIMVITLIYWFHRELSYYLNDKRFESSKTYTRELRLRLACREPLFRLPCRLLVLRLACREPLFKLPCKLPLNESFLSPAWMRLLFKLAWRELWLRLPCREALIRSNWHMPLLWYGSLSIPRFDSPAALLRPRISRAWLLLLCPRGRAFVRPNRSMADPLPSKGVLGCDTKLPDVDRPAKSTEKQNNCIMKISLQTRALSQNVTNAPEGALTQT